MRVRADTPFQTNGGLTTFKTNYAHRHSRTFRLKMWTRWPSSPGLTGSSRPAPSTPAVASMDPRSLFPAPDGARGAPRPITCAGERPAPGLPRSSRTTAGAARKGTSLTMGWSNLPSVEPEIGQRHASPQSGIACVYKREHNTLITDWFRCGIPTRFYAAMGNDKNGNGLAELEKRLWAAADQLWANSPLRPSEYSVPVLGLIFLRYADHKFTKAEAKLTGRPPGGEPSARPTIRPRASSYLPDAARFSSS